MACPTKTWSLLLGTVFTLTFLPAGARAQDQATEERLAAFEQSAARCTNRLENLASGAGLATRVDKVLRGWEEGVAAVVGQLPEDDPAARARVQRACLPVLHQWLRLIGPQQVLADLPATCPSLETVLSWPGEQDGRLATLSRVLELERAAGGKTDLDRFASLVAWAAVFHRALPAGAGQLDAVTGDLILLLTERAANGIRKSGSKYYQRGRFGDSGFAPELADGGDQVRHFTWAFRMFAISRQRDTTEWMLAQKEQLDARQRKQPVNQADLQLNRTARACVEAILNEGGEPVPAAGYAEVLRARLGVRDDGK